MTVKQHLEILARVAIPVWLIDYVNQKMIWGNAKAIHLWGASDLEELTQRDFTKTSDAIRARQRTTQALIEAGESETRLITFYPHERMPVTARCHISGFQMDDGRIVALTQALDTTVAIDPEQLRGVEAIRRIGAMVTLLDGAGRVLMQNPSGAEAFGSDNSFASWIVDEGVARAIERAIRDKQAYRQEALVQTRNGQRWHVIEAHRSMDPVTGEQCTLLVQVDVTENRRMQEAMADQARQIRELSVPILNVGRDVLALPLIGTLDERRSQEIAARLLPEVVRIGAGTVILDLTGVNRLDLESANAVMNVARALQLLGAEPILTGIQPLMAKPLAQSGVDLGQIVTLRNLHEGLKWSRGKSTLARSLGQTSSTSRDDKP